MSRPTVTWEPAAAPPTHAVAVLLAIQTLRDGRTSRVVRAGYRMDGRWHIDSAITPPDSEVVAWSPMPEPPGGWLDEDVLAYIRPSWAEGEGL